MFKNLYSIIAVVIFACCVASAQRVSIHMLDYCDPVTFNAALGDGACVRDTAAGIITFDGFLGELAAEKSAGAWRLSPNRTLVGEHAPLKIANLGGELHTFTKVKKFGGGFVAVLNDVSGNPKPAPECARVVDGNLVPQPPSANNLFIPAGASANHPASDNVVRYQCCIHPWMRTTIQVEQPQP